MSAYDFCDGQAYSVEEIEQASIERMRQVNREFPDRERPAPEVPFGFMNQEWQAFKAQMQPNDSVVYFCTSPKTWERMAGREGFFIRRDGVRMRTIVTRMN